MRRFILSSLFALLGILPVAAQTPKLPRPTPPLEITMPDGTKLNLSRYAGKVCVVEFLFTTCPHCQDTARVLTQLGREYGPRGFQPVGAAFNDNAMMLVPEFVQKFQVGYPVGVAPRETVLKFMEFSIMEFVNVPLVAIIDRKGQIRYQSTARGPEVLHAEASLRQKIEELLKEPAPTAKKAVSAVKKTD